MSRLPRSAFETTFFHVIVQGINKEEIFSQPQFKSYYLELVAKLKEKFEVKLLAYCVMDTHCHMLLHVPDVERMSRFMLKVNTMYAQFYNFATNRVGYVFRDRFKSQPIFDEKYLVNCTLYIQNNPVKAGIVQSAIDYEHSSMRDYVMSSGFVDLDDARQIMLISPKDMLDLMGKYSASDDELDWIDVKEEALSDDVKADKAIDAHRSDAAADLFGKSMRDVAREMSERGLSADVIAKKLGKGIRTIYRWLEND